MTKDVLAGAAGPDTETLAGLRQLAAVILGPRRPDPGERAAGHGVSGTIIGVPELQPLGTAEIWRVSLAGEPFGRLVRRSRQNRLRAWQLLQLNDLTDVQFDAYEAAMQEQPRRAVLVAVA